MTGYVVGKHDDPSDTQDRLVRIGSKYQATAPSVADGDTVYLLVDAAGRPLIVGPAAHDAEAVGNPLRLGGVYRSTLPGVAAADIVDLLMSAEGRPRIEEYLIQQARIGNQKSTQAALGKTTTAEEDITSWTVTNGKTGYLSYVTIAWQSHASETLHDIRVYNDTTAVHRFRFGQGDRQYTLTIPIPHKLDSLVKTCFEEVPAI